MIKSVLLVFFFSFFSYPNSLYTDDVNDVMPVIESSPSIESYQYSQDDSVLESSNLKHLDNYSSVVFDLSQQTDKLRSIVDESIIYSDINRLLKISDELLTLLGPNKINLNFKSSRELSSLQSKFQETIFRLYALSPYMPYLLKENNDKTTYYIKYLTSIKSQMSKNVDQMLALQNQLNVGSNSQLPFQPNTPSQLSFALENQLNSSVLTMFGEQQSGSDVPYSAISTPANADLFNQTNSPFPNSNLSSTPNGAPLQLMNFIPSF